MFTLKNRVAKQSMKKNNWDNQSRDDANLFTRCSLLSSELQSL